MDTAVTTRGRTVVPAAVRRRHQIKTGDRLAWIDDGLTIRVVPLTGDPIDALRGIGKGDGLSEQLLEARTVDRRHDS